MIRIDRLIEVEEICRLTLMRYLFLNCYANSIKNKVKKIDLVPPFAMNLNF